MKRKLIGDFRKARRGYKKRTANDTSGCETQAKLYSITETINIKVDTIHTNRYKNGSS